MTIQIDSQELEMLLRKVVREELRRAVVETEPTVATNTESEQHASDEDYRTVASQVFKSHKKVLDALA